MDRKFVMTALLYAVVGLALGIYMAASKDKGQLVTHAHIMLIGFVVTLSYALLHKLWLTNCYTTLAKAQFYVHQIGTIVLLIGLFLFFGQIVPLEQVDPILAIASITVFIGMVLMLILFIKSS
ncbi:TonB-dependent receptor [Thiomicrorhabdus sediminis]|uniref:TonB-dependent receptor n=2 Tax=Thiomicrorhabdus sediminis TaxID=2580412 RepID=A0A4P9K9E6_9GAMM|nr:TonB-dependent receptor [Thiomicrorhabdus sediminis]